MLPQKYLKISLPEKLFPPFETKPECLKLEKHSWFSWIFCEAVAATKVRVKTGGVACITMLPQSSKILESPEIGEK